MKLLIVTQKMDMNDPVLGFFHSWAGYFARHFDSIIVVCLSEGAHSLPANVEVLSLGKERGASRAQYMSRFYRLIASRRSDYDAVFVHMNPIYVVLGGLFWKAWGKTISLWYTHKEADLKLRIAVAFSDVIFTAARESFTLASPKVMVTGHGIDVGAYASAARSKPLGVEPIRIASVGRVTPIKDPITLIKAAAILRDSWKKKFEIAFIGAPATDADRAYAGEAEALVDRLGLRSIVRFRGNVLPSKMPELLAGTDATINLTPTGGVDKAVLESMAAGVPAFSANEAFRSYFGPLAPALIFGHADPADLAGKIQALFDGGDIAPAGRALQQTAKERCEAEALIGRIAERLSVGRS